MRKSWIFSIFLCIAILVLGCNSLLKDKRRYVVLYKPFFCLEDPFSVPIIKKSGIQNNKLFFKVTPRFTYENRIDRDTVTIEYSKSNNLGKREYEFYLTIDEIMNIDRLEELLTSLNLQRHNLKENIYWIKELANARLVTVRNKFGDIEGYYAKSSNGNVIPKRYYDLKTADKLIGDSGVIIESKPIELGRIEHGGNILRLRLESTFDFRKDRKTLPNMNNVVFDALYTDRLTLLSANGKEVNISSNGTAIGLEIWMNSEITFNKDQITTAPNFAPFDISFLN